MRQEKGKNKILPNNKIPNVMKIQFFGGIENNHELYNHHVKKNILREMFIIAFVHLFS